MAISAILDVSALDNGSILAPERYDPRRRQFEYSRIRLSDIVSFVRDQVSASTATEAQQFVVLATGDAHNGMVKATKAPCRGSEIGSAKKRVRQGQVIISRLRPYLRQVAWVDSGLLNSESPSVELVCSSEFYVLDSVDGSSIAFLVPFLLSERVQSILMASQEGGHHPRFNERTLRGLPIPDSLFEQREALSTDVELAVNRARQAFREIEESIGSAESLF